MAMSPMSAASLAWSKQSATSPIAARQQHPVAVGARDARALLSAMLQRVEAEVGEIGRFGMPEDAEDATLVAEFVHVSLCCCRLPTPAPLLRRPGPTRRHPRLDRGAPGRLGLGDGQRERLAPVDGDADLRPAGAADDAGRESRPRRPAPTTASACAAAVDTTIMRRRFAEQRLLVGTAPADAPAHGSPIAAGTSTLTPMPSVSKQHSASVTARPPSETSCADSIEALGDERGQELLHRALAREIDARRHAAHQPVHGLEVFAAAQLAALLTHQDHGAPFAAEAAIDDGRGVVEETDDADDGRRQNGAPVGLIVQADVAAGDRNLEGAARLADALRRPGRAAT